MVKRCHFEFLRKKSSNMPVPEIAASVPRRVIVRASRRCVCRWRLSKRMVLSRFCSSLSPRYYCFVCLEACFIAMRPVASSLPRQHQRTVTATLAPFASAAVASLVQDVVSPLLRPRRLVRPPPTGPLPVFVSAAVTSSSKTRSPPSFDHDNGCGLLRPGLLRPAPLEPGRRHGRTCRAADVSFSSSGPQTPLPLPRLPCVAWHGSPAPAGST